MSRKAISVTLNTCASKITLPLAKKKLPIFKRTFFFLHDKLYSFKIVIIGNSL